MIRKPDNWENVQAFSDRKTLPVGGYVCRIKQSAVQPVGDGQQLAVLFDIVEGDYAGFYEDDFRGNTRDDKKWKGVLRIWLPKYDGSERMDGLSRLSRASPLPLRSPTPATHGTGMNRL